VIFAEEQLIPDTKKYRCMVNCCGVSTTVSHKCAFVLFEFEIFEFVLEYKYSNKYVTCRIRIEYLVQL